MCVGVRSDYGTLSGAVASHHRFCVLLRESDRLNARTFGLLLAGFVVSKTNPQLIDILSCLQWRGLGLLGSVGLDSWFPITLVQLLV